MEFIKVIILTILLTLTITTPCGDNPALPKFEEFFYDVSADNPDFNVMLEEYLDMEPLTFTEGTLGHCGELFQAGDKVCCKDEFFQSFKDILSSKGQGKMKKPPIQLKMLKDIGRAIGKCSGKLDTMAPDFEKQPPPELNAVVEKLKECFGLAVVDQQRFQRGLFCSLCIAPDQYDQFFGQTISETLPNGKTIEFDAFQINEDSFNTYLENVSVNMQCLDDLNAELQSAIETFINTAGAAGDSKKCDHIKAKVEDMLKNNGLRPCQGGDCQTKCAARAQPFGKDCQEDASDAAMGQPGMDQRRVLTTTTDQSIELKQNRGFSAYTLDNTNDKAIYDKLDNQSLSIHCMIQATIMILLMLII